MVELGIPSVLLFGLPPEKDGVGSGAYDPRGSSRKPPRTIKERAPGLMVIGDVCLCEYTDHGHCGVIDGDRIDNDATLELLARSALTQVQAGADMVAPSSMMDGQVRAIREMLDAHGYDDTPIMGYAAKYASSFYGPFRVAADSTPQFGDRRSYQMDPANRRMAMREIESDIAEGADIVMVKPGHGVHGRHQGGPRTVRLPSGGLQRERRILDGESRLAGRLDRRKAGHTGTADGDPSSRRRHHHLLSCQGSGPLAAGAGVGSRPATSRKNPAR